MRIPISKAIEDPFEIMEHHFRLMKMEDKYTREIARWNDRCFFCLVVGVFVFLFASETSLTAPLLLTLIGTALAAFFLIVNFLVYPSLETCRGNCEKEGLFLEKEHPEYFGYKHFEILLETKLLRFVMGFFAQSSLVLISSGTAIFGVFKLCIEQSLILASLVGAIGFLCLALLIFLLINGSRKRQKIIDRSF